MSTTSKGGGDAPILAHLTVAERTQLGLSAREKVPPSRHSGWVPASDRKDPIDLIAGQETNRDADLVPVRHERMSYSCFSFYRGGARVMANDLGPTSVSGLPPVMLCGDAHLLNFGLFGSAERTLVFDLNDFDEGLPGPFEFDVKRLAASFAIAGRHNELSEAEIDAATEEVARAYRVSMAKFSEMSNTEIYYQSLPVHTVEEVLTRAAGEKKKKKDKKKDKKGKKGKKGKKSGRGLVHGPNGMPWTEKIAKKAQSHDSEHALNKLGSADARGQFRIISEPPLIVPFRDLPNVYPWVKDSPEVLVTKINDAKRQYRESLQYNRKHLLEQYEFVDAARKVVGVGSVGTRCYIMLLMGRDPSDPLFLQLKEATRSVLEDVLPASEFAHQGQRCVTCQRMMQSSSDVFLGWSNGVVDSSRHFYWRQLKDMKGSVIVEDMDATQLFNYAYLCGWTLARAHARSGDSVAIAAYLGGDEDVAFDEAILDFSKRYADQVKKDYDAFLGAIESGRLRVPSNADNSQDIGRLDL